MNGTQFIFQVLFISTLLFDVFSDPAYSQDSTINSIENNDEQFPPEITSGYISPVNGDLFGQSIAVSNNIVVIGAPDNDSMGLDAGSVYLYEDPTGWGIENRTFQLTPHDPEPGDNFGYSVAISGNTVAISSPLDDEEKKDSGSVYIFEKTKNGWIETFKITTVEPIERGRFGEAVSLYEDTLIVTSINDMKTNWDENLHSGAGFVLERMDSKWGYKGKLTTTNDQEGDLFGRSVAIDEDTIVISANMDDEGGFRAGAAYVYAKPINGWQSMTETAKLKASDVKRADKFGTSVSISNDTIVIGSPGAPYLNRKNHGAVYVYEKPDTGWATMTESSKITPIIFNSGQRRFGSSVNIVNDSILVGAPGDLGNRFNAGITYLFKKPVDGWSTLTDYIKFEHSETKIGNRFGLSIDFDTNLIVIVSRTLKNSTKLVNVFEKPKFGWISTTETVQLPIKPIENIGLYIIYFFTFLFAVLAMKHYIQLQVSLHKQKQTVSVLEHTQNRLEREKLKAEEAAQIERRFLTHMSHEIRTPLNGIIGSLELLNTTNDEKKKKTLSSTAYATSKTLLSLIGDVLDFSKISENELELNPTTFSPSSLLLEVHSIMSAKAQQQNIPIYIDADPNVPELIHTDPERLRQVLLNLVGNSIKFTQEGGIFITLICDSIAENIVTLKFLIQDTGEGFQPELSKMIFHQFKQIESTSKSTQGTGLGLTISKHIVEKMGGQIECDGYPGYGSLFWFTITADVMNHSTFKYDLSNVSILLIDEHNSKLSAQIMHKLHENKCAVHFIDRYQNIEEDKNYDAIVVVSDSVTAVLKEWILRNKDKKTKLILLSNSTDPTLSYIALKNGFHYAFQNEIKWDHLSWILMPNLIMKSTSFSQNIDLDFKDNHSKEKNFGSLPVLFIDDSATNRDVIKFQFEELGLSAEIAENGLIALEKSQTNEYSLIFTDCSMPEMDGYEFAQKFREWENTNRVWKTAIVAITANVISGTKEQCLSAGMDDYMAKPIHLHDLAEMCHKWIGSSVETSKKPK